MYISWIFIKKPIFPSSDYIKTFLKSNYLFNNFLKHKLWKTHMQIFNDYGIFFFQISFFSSYCDCVSTRLLENAPNSLMQLTSLLHKLYTPVSYTHLDVYKRQNTLGEILVIFLLFSAQNSQ